MKTDIFIVSFLKDVEWLKLCLRSIQKFATGFEQVMVALPSQDMFEVINILAKDENGKWTFPVHTRSYSDDPDNGHMMHQVQKCCADVYCPQADFILHMDSDCIFTEPVTPGDYLVDGKPVLLIDLWENVGAAQIWRGPTERAVGWNTLHETMRRHPAVHYRWIYYALRDRIEELHGPFFQYILGQKGTDQYEFSEFNALGQIAVSRVPERYHIIDLSKEKRPHDKLLQFWSHGQLDQPQHVWIDGVETQVVPIEHARKILQ